MIDNSRPGPTPGRRLSRDDIAPHTGRGPTRTCACRPPAGSASLLDLLMYPGPRSYPSLRSDPMDPT